MTKKKEILDFLESLINYEKIELESNKNLLHQNNFIPNFIKHSKIILDNIQFIHISGTNGKGSVATILSFFLHKIGYKIGLYLSPHLKSINERIQINNIPINDAYFISMVNIFKKIIQKITIKPTFFEAMTALAILFFSKQHCNFIILETGLGGKFDSTNYITNNKLCIINTIHYDHSKQLGNDLKTIAKEKVGIVKEGNITLINKQPQILYSFLSTYMKNKKIKCFFYKKDFYFSKLNIKKNINFNCHLENDIYNIETSLLSIHQILNLNLSLMVLKILKINFTEKIINNYLKKFYIMGRFHLYSKNPSVLLDGAHNIHAIKALKVNLKLRFNECRKKILFIGISEGKNYSSILDILVNFFDQIIVIKLNFSLKKEISNKIYNKVKDMHSNTLYYDSFAKAYEYIQFFITKKDLLLITGSFYLIGEALEYFDSKKTF